jgi:hypothetical protein
MLNVLSQRMAKYALQKANRLTSARIPFGRTWYFAFGANMDAELLAKKCIFPQSSHPGVVEGFKIEISSPCEMTSKGFASITACAGASVFGVLHRLSWLEMSLLDVLEWVPFRFHHRVKVTATSLDGDQSVVAWAYVATNRTVDLKTSIGYRDLLVRSAKKAGLPQRYLAELAALPVADVFNFDHGFRLSNPAKRRWFEKHLGGIYRIHDDWREKLCQRLP